MVQLRFARPAKMRTRILQGAECTAVPVSLQVSSTALLNELVKLSVDKDTTNEATQHPLDPQETEDGHAVFSQSAIGELET